VNLTVTNAGGSDSEVKTDYITVTAAPVAPTAAFTSDVQTGTAPLTVTFTDQSTGDTITAWAWDFQNDGTVDSTEQNPVFIYSTAGTYTVNLTVTNAGGSDSEVKTNYLTVNAAPTPDYTLLLTGDHTVTLTKAEIESIVANGQSVSYTDTTNGRTWNGIPLWYLVGAVDDSDTGFNFNDNRAAMNYQVQVRAGDGFAKNFTSSAIAGSSNYIIANTLNGSVIPFTDPTNSNKLWWPLKGVGSGMSGGNSVGNITEIRLIGLPVPPVANFTATPLNGNAPLTVQFMDISTGTAPLTYVWDFNNDGVTDNTTQSPSYTYVNAGTYTVNLTVTNGAGSDSEIKTGYITVEDDADNDGILDSEEQGPGGADPVYDGNGDGTPDRQQENVASFHTTTDAYVTLVSLGGMHLTDVQAVDNPSPADTPVYLTMPFGFINFTITGITPGGAVTVQLYLPAGSTFDTYYKYGETPDNAIPHWYEFLFDGTTGAEISENIITLHFVDGIRGDNDITANGIIIDPSGPGIDIRTPPTAAFSANPVSGTAPLLVQFTDASTGTAPLSYAWDFNNDGLTDNTTQSPSYTYATAGTYTVNLTVTNEAGSDFEVKTGHITVNSPLIAPTAAFSSDIQTGTAPLTVTFTDASTGTGPLTYAWDFNNDGTIDSTVKNPAYVYSIAGTYTVNLSVTGPGGSDSELKTDYITVTVKPPVPIKPEAAFSGTPTSGNAPLTVQFTDQSKNTPTSWKWEYKKGSGSWTQFSTAPSPSYTFPATGTYGIRLTATNAAGSNTQTKTSFLTVTALQKPDAAFIGAPTSGYAPLTVAFTDQSTNTPTSWKWEYKKGSGSWTQFSTAQSPSYTFTATGTYSIRLTATNAAGSNTQMKTSYITVTALEKPVAAFSATPLSGSVPLTVKFTDKSTGTAPLTYAWDFNNDGVVDSTVKDPTYTYTKTGTYIASLKVTNTAGSSTKQVTITVQPPAVKKPVAQFMQNTYIGKVPLTVQFTDKSQNNPTSYLWHFGDGSTSTAKSPSHTYTSPGVYVVRLTAINSAGSDTETSYVAVLPKRWFW
jgi:PKD repeat protein